MGKYRTKSTFYCPYCNIVGWQKRGDRDSHIKKSHPGEKPVGGTGIGEMFRNGNNKEKESLRYRKS